MRSLSIVALGLSLAACGTIANPVTQNQLYNAEAAYGVALSALKGYRTSCIQHVALVYPKCRTVIPILQDKVRTVQGTLVAARTFIRNNPNVSPISLVSAVQQALTDFQNAEAQYGVK